MRESVEKGCVSVAGLDTNTMEHHWTPACVHTTATQELMCNFSTQGYLGSVSWCQTQTPLARPGFIQLHFLEEVSYT